MSLAQGIRNFGAKAGRRLSSVHKPFVRALRRHQRGQEHDAFARDAAALDRRIADLAAGGGPIVAGPWLAEVGYEVLYWVPFLRWFVDAYRVDPARITVISRGGMDGLYAGVAGRYVDLFDLMSPATAAAKNAQRQSSREGGGQKQSDVSPYDRELIDTAGAAGAGILHPSLMFGLFRHAWHGNVPMDMFWQRTRYLRIDAPPPAEIVLPPDFVAAKLYTGPALAPSAETRAAVRSLVARIAAGRPVVAMTTNLGLDEHDDFDLSNIPGVVDAAQWMTPRNNLAVQLSIIGASRTFVSTCGGLAWVAPFLGVPTIGVYDSDHLLASHLLVERQAGKRAGAAEFSTVDLRAVAQLGLLQHERPALQ